MKWDFKIHLFSAGRNANTEATEYVTFGFSFCILVFFSLLAEV